LLSLFFFSLQFYDVYGGLRHLPQPYGGFCDGVCNSLAASMVLGLSATYVWWRMSAMGIRI